MIVSDVKAVVSPIAPCIAIAPAFVSISKVFAPSTDELKVTVVSACWSASITTFCVKVTGPVIETVPAEAVLLAVRFPPRETPPAPTRVTDPEVAAPPRVIDPLAPPSVRVKVSSIPALVIVPETEIFPPPLLRLKLPSLRTRLPVNVAFPVISISGFVALAVIFPALVIVVAPPNS